MIRSLFAAALVALIALAGAGPADAAVEEKRFHLQVRNVKQGEELRLAFTSPGVLNVLIADIRLGGVAKTLADDEVTMDGATLVVRTTEKPRLNVNLTLYARCEGACPAVLEGGVELPPASYAMLRTKLQDVALTQSGGWTLKLTGG